MIIKAFTCIAIFIYFSRVKAKFCREYGETENVFHPLRHCQRSNKTVIAFYNVECQEDCAEHARNTRGLAFNFSPSDRKINLFERETRNKTTRGEDDDFYNCEVLECPEFRNFSTMVNDTRFDYYSLYTHPAREYKNLHSTSYYRKFYLASENATCVGSIGMFMLSNERANYSLAYNICSSLGGNLAHVASDERNTELSKLLKISTNSSLKERIAYVGLNETSYDNFFTSHKVPLTCFLYRAWAPGHPPGIRRPGCVAITPEASWKVFNCNRKLLFVCELLMSGPNPFVNFLNQTCSVRRPNNRLMPKKKLFD